MYDGLLQWPPNRWAHIPNEKRKTLHPKSEKCIFFRYFENVKDYRLLLPNSNEIFIRIDVNFDENLSTCMPNSTFVPFSTCEPYSMSVSSSLPNFSISDLILVSSSNDDSEHENPPFPTLLHLVESIGHELRTSTSIPIWVRTT
jgi:hypothetical protein